LQAASDDQAADRHGGDAAVSAEGLRSRLTQPSDASLASAAVFVAQQESVPTSASQTLPPAPRYSDGLIATGVSTNHASSGASATTRQVAKPSLHRLLDQVFADLDDGLRDHALQGEEVPT